MAARCGEKAIHLASDISQLALSAVLCSVYSYGSQQAAYVSCQLRAGAKLHSQTLLSSGDTVYKHKEEGGFNKSFGTHKIQSSKKKQMK